LVEFTIFIFYPVAAQNGNNSNILFKSGQFECVILEVGQIEKMKIPK
jgi:hypothetical protein